MKGSLYSYFGCESKEELYNKVRENHAEVRSLRDFIEYSKGDRENDNHHIVSPEDFVRYVRNDHLPGEDECKIVFVNTKNVPIHTGTFFVSDKKSFHSVIKEGLQAGGVGCLVLSNKKDMAYEIEIKDFLELINVEPLDVFRYNHESQTVYSTRGSETFRLDSMRFNSEVKDSYETFNKYLDGDLVNLEGFEEFSSFYAREEVVGLNAFDEVDDVQDALKVGYQFDQQEVFGLITCNSEGDVLSLSELFKGSANASIVDPRVYTQKVLEDDEVAYVAVFHNHPSGDPLTIV